MKLTLATTLLLAAPVPVFGAALHPVQGAGIDPAQVLTTTQTSSPDAIGDQADVDGDQAIVLGGPTHGEAPAGPLRVLFLERDATGVWSETQALDLPFGTNPLGDGTVDIQGDLATVFVRRTITTYTFRDYVHIFERDAQGVWSRTRTFTGGFPMSDLGAPRQVAISGDDILVLEAVVLGVRVLRRTGGPGTWTQVQDFGFAGGLATPFELATDGDLVVLTDGFIGALAFERDGAGVWNQVGSFPLAAGPGGYGAMIATDGERFVRVLRTATYEVEALEIYSRPDPAQPTHWIVEDSVDPGRRLDIGFPFTPPPTGSFQRIFFENDTIVLRTTEACGGGYDQFVLTVRRAPGSGVWVVDDPVCTVPLTGEPNTRLLDFDGSTLVAGDRATGGAGTTAGAISFSTLENVWIDCDLDGTPDQLQLATCTDCDLNGNGRLDVCEPVGTPSCGFQGVNSSGRVADLSAFGQPEAGGSTVLLRATETSTNTFGLLISGGQTTNQAIMLGNGWRCLGGPQIGRFDGQIGATGPDGAFDTLVDPQAVPTPAGSIALTAGTTWYFQGWFRDGSSANLTNMVAVTFD